MTTTKTKGVDDMDTENKNAELDNQVNQEAKDELREAVEETLSKIRTQNMLLGAQAVCKMVLDKIYAFESSYGKKSTNDYKRCIKEVKRFCEVGLSRKVNTDGTTEPIETTEVETEQN